MTPTDVSFRDGPTVSSRVVNWLIDADRRGVQLTLREDDRIIVRPHPARGSADDVFLRANRDAIAALLAYIRDGIACTCPDAPSSRCPWHGDAQPGLFEAAS